MTNPGRKIDDHAVIRKAKGRDSGCNALDVALAKIGKAGDAMASRQKIKAAGACSAPGDAHDSFSQCGFTVHHMGEG